MFLKISCLFYINIFFFTRSATHSRYFKKLLKLTFRPILGPQDGFKVYQASWYGVNSKLLKPWFQIQCQGPKKCTKFNIEIYQSFIKVQKYWKPGSLMFHYAYCIVKTGNKYPSFFMRIIYMPKVWVFVWHATDFRNRTYQCVQRY